MKTLNSDAYCVSWQLTYWEQYTVHPSSFQIQTQTNLVSTLIEILGVNQWRQRDLDSVPQTLGIRYAYVAVVVHLSLLCKDKCKNELIWKTLEKLKVKMCVEICWMRSSVVPAPGVEMLPVYLSISGNFRKWQVSAHDKDGKCVFSRVSLPIKREFAIWMVFWP